MILVGRSLFLSVEVGTILMRLAANSRFFSHVFGQPLQRRTLLILRRYYLRRYYGSRRLKSSAESCKVQWT